MSKLERMIAAVAPELALKRATARHNLKVVNQLTSRYSMSNSAYAGADYGRNRSAPLSSTSSEDKAAGWQMESLIANAMQLYRDDPLTKSIVNVSGTYLGESRPTATTSDPEWNRLATQYFNEYWWPQADARGRSGIDFGEFQNLFDHWCWVGGDMLFLPQNGQLLPYEGLQIKTPNDLTKDKNIINGVRIQASSPWRVSHYYLCDRTNDGKQIFSRVNANDAIYAGARNWRVSMLRSVPDLHGVIDALYHYGQTQDNVQKRIEFESMLFTIERKGAVGHIPGSRILGSAGDGNTQVEHSKADWGMRLKVNGDVNNDFKLAQMQNPSANYVPVMEHMARVLAAGTGFPYEVIMHIYTNGSYTANRAARVDFAKALLRRWAWRNKVLNQRVWNWRIAKAIKDGELPAAPVNPDNGLSQWFKCAWTLPHFPHIDEGKEVVADIKQWGCGQESFADWAQQKGQSRTQMLDAHDDDIREIKRRAEALELPLEVYMGQLFTASAAKSMNETQPAEQGE